MALVDMSPRGPARRGRAPAETDSSGPSRLRLRGLRPHQLLILGFAGSIAVGAVLLRLPISSRGPPLSWTNALFTATSAVCVTGLVVVDTGGDLSAFGQAVLLVLFQMGGLGIMTFSTLLLLAARGRPSLAAMEATGEALGTSHPSHVREMVKGVVLVTLAVEAAAVVVLFALFLFHRTAAQTVLHCAWSALFHSVSAFCNAGFSLYSDSLAAYRGAWGVNLVVMALVILGGIGFPVMRDIARKLRAWRKGEKSAPVGLHTKIVLVTTATLLVLGTLSLLATEWGGARGLPAHERLLSALFQSTAARTAGFSTVNVGKLAPATLFFIAFLMFIGASPCSTGGGIKTSTLGVLGVLAVSKLRGREEPSAFGRSIPRRVVSRAVTVAILSGLLVLAFIWLLLVSEGDRFRSVDVVFEAVSAFGTVGLSTGITPRLATASKLLLVALMFIGRLGPLTIVVLISRRERPDGVKYPSEPLLIG